MSNYEKVFIPNDHLYFAMFDAAPNGLKQIDYDQLVEYNLEKYGVYHSVHQFKNNNRKSENLKKILFWAIDIDEGSKKHQSERIKKGLKPSYVIETKRGYQIYFKAKDATKDNYLTIMEALILFYGGDKQAKDYSRIMRVEGFNHWKGEAPFLCKEAYYSKVEYTEAQVFEWCSKLKVTEDRKKNIDFRQNRYNNRVEGNKTVYEPKDDVFEGSRVMFLNRYGFILKKINGLSDAEVEKRLHIFNATHVKPPISERELDTILKSLERVV